MFWRSGPRRFSQAMHPYASARTAGGLLFVSGQLGVANGELVVGGVIPETRQAFDNLRGVLVEHELALDDVVKITVYLATLRDRRGMDTVYAELTAGRPPARTCFAVGALPYGARVELDVVAELGDPVSGPTRS